MSAGIRLRDVVGVLLGLGLGWAGRAMIVPTPEVVLLAPRVQCGGLHEVGVPMLENAQWGVQSGSRWWSGKGWGSAPEWRTRPGTVIVGVAPEGVRLAVKGFKSANVAGTFIRTVKVAEPDKLKEGEEKKP